MSDLSDRCIIVRDKPASQQPKCATPCVYLYIGNRTWRCERCLHYLGVDLAKQEEKGLFD